MRITALLGLAAFSTACGGSLYEVSRVDTEGIPFFPIENVEQRVVTHHEAIWEIRLDAEFADTPTLDEAAPPPKPATADKKAALSPAPAAAPAAAQPALKISQARYVTAAACLDEISSAFNSGRTPSAALSAVGPYLLAPITEANGAACGKAVLHAAPPVIAAEPTTLPKIAETIKHVQRPSAHPMYINVDKAAIGTTSATIKLASNGTLTEATASVEDKTAEVILGVLPIKELISNIFKLGDGGEEKVVGGPTGGPSKVTLTIKDASRRYVWTYERRCDADSNEADVPPNPCRPSEHQVDFQVVPISAPAAPKDDKPAIKVEGTIVLPEAK